MDYIWLTYSYKDASTEETETRTDRYSYAFDRDSDTEYVIIDCQFLYTFSCVLPIKVCSWTIFG